MCGYLGSQGPLAGAKGGGPRAGAKWGVRNGGAKVRIAPPVVARYTDLDATLSKLRSPLGAEPKTDLSGLRGIAINRRRQLDPEKAKGHLRPAVNLNVQRQRLR